MKDIVCGKDIPAGKEIKTTHYQKDYYFCSETCAKTFAQDPFKYTDKSKSTSSNKGSEEGGNHRV